MKIRIFANAAHIMSGGDKIYMEYARRWKQWGNSIAITTNEVGRSQCIDHGIAPSDIVLWSSSSFDRFGAFVFSIIKTLQASVHSLLYRLDEDVFFSASFIWPDLLPGLIAKMKRQKSVWIVAWYVFLPHPFIRHYPCSRLNLAIFYCMQQISYFLVSRFADLVFTASSKDVPAFTKISRLKKNVHAIRGGLDYAFFRAGKQEAPLYDAVFLGRFHPQKNVEELIDIWKDVVAKKRDATLALVGDGSLKTVLRARVGQYSLQRNIIFLGMLDGEEKRTVFKKSRLFVSASRFDSGNLALDEALASGVPGVLYDLVHLDYEQGVAFVPVGNHRVFVETIVQLLADEAKRKKLSNEAVRVAAEWDWDKKAATALGYIQALV